MRDSHKGFWSIVAILDIACLLISVYVKLMSWSTKYNGPEILRRVNPDHLTFIIIGNMVIAIGCLIKLITD